MLPRDIESDACLQATSTSVNTARRRIRHVMLYVLAKNAERLPENSSACREQDGGCSSSGRTGKGLKAQLHSPLVAAGLA